MVKFVKKNLLTSDIFELIDEDGRLSFFLVEHYSSDGYQK